MVLINTLLSALFCVGFNTSPVITCEIYLDIDGIEYEEVFTSDTTKKDVVLDLGTSFGLFYNGNNIEYETYLDTEATTFTFTNIVRAATINSFIVHYTLNSFTIDQDLLYFNYTINCEVNYSDRLGKYQKSLSNVYENTFNEYPGIQELEQTFSRDININLETVESGAYSDGYQAGYSDGYQAGEDDGYLSGKEDGYNLGFIDGYNKGLIDGNTETNIFTYLNGVFRAVDAFLSVEIIPGITLWAIVLIPIVFGVIAFFLNLWR